jgi:hypothetical protein
LSGDLSNIPERPEMYESVFEMGNENVDEDI